MNDLLLQISKCSQISSLLKDGDCYPLFRRAIFKLQAEGLVIVKGDKIELTEDGRKKLKEK